MRIQIEDVLSVTCSRLLVVTVGEIERCIKKHLKRMIPSSHKIMCEPSKGKPGKSSHQEQGGESQRRDGVHDGHKSYQQHQTLLPQHHQQIPEQEYSERPAYIRDESLVVSALLLPPTRPTRRLSRQDHFVLPTIPSGSPADDDDGYYDDCGTTSSSKNNLSALQLVQPQRRLSRHLSQNSRHSSESTMASSRMPSLYTMSSGPSDGSLASNMSALSLFSPPINAQPRFRIVTDHSHRGIPSELHVSLIEEVSEQGSEEGEEQESTKEEQPEAIVRHILSPKLKKKTLDRADKWGTGDAPLTIESNRDRTKEQGRSQSTDGPMVSPKRR